MNADSNADLTFIGTDRALKNIGWKQTDSIPMKLTQFKKYNFSNIQVSPCMTYKPICPYQGYRTTFSKPFVLPRYAAVTTI